MKTQLGSETPVLYTVPLKMWLVGAGCIALPAFLVANDVSTYIEMWRAEIADPAILMAMAWPVIVGTGLFLCLTLAAVRVEIDDHANLLQITRKSVLRTTVETVPFSQIMSIDTRASARSDESDDLEVFITLRDSTEIALNCAPVSDMQAAFVVDILRRATRP